MASRARVAQAGFVSVASSGADRRVGGRTTASSLIDAGLVQDLLLTTTARSGGDPNTPFYVGSRPPPRDLIVRKTGTDPEYPIVVEHFALRSDPAV